MLTALLLSVLASGPTAGASSGLAIWPAAGAVLNPPVLPAASTRRLRVFIDPGHGAPANSGNSGVDCEAEEVFTLRTAEALAAHLRSTGRFEVRLAREGAARPTYQRRLHDAEAWRADVFLSLHSDARGLAEWWRPDETRQCLRQDTTPGFAVLFSREAAPRLRSRREGLAVALARQLSSTGFTTFDGLDYWGLFDPHPAQPGVFSDRRRLYFLRKPSMPSVIIETHHALDLEEARRWREPRTLDAFGRAVAAALVQWATPRPPS